MRKITLLTSHKPWDDAESAKRQRRALDSWSDLGIDVVVFNKPEDLAGYGGKVRFVDLGSQPPIKDMLGWYMENYRDAEDIVGIINSDIVLTPEFLNVQKLSKEYGRLWAATSFRHQYKDGQEVGVTDLGLDIFIGPRRVIYECFWAIPEFLVIGKCLWDNWMNGFITKTLQSGRYFDITDWKAVWHYDHPRPPDSHRCYSPAQQAQVFEDPAIAYTGIPQTHFVL